MGYQPDVPGPGEDPGLEDVSTEPANPLAPEGGFIPHTPPPAHGARSASIPAWRSGEPADSAEPSGTDILRRTGTHVVVGVSESESSIEQRADRSALDLLREERFDPAQDDAGSQLD